MSLRKSGADCPYDAGGLMRRGVLALVVLLLACVLMAGAVSAEENAVTVTIGEYRQSYSTLAEAFADVVNFSIGNNSQLLVPRIQKVRHSIWRKGMISLSRMVRLLHLHLQRMSKCLCRTIVI